MRGLEMIYMGSEYGRKGMAQLMLAVEEGRGMVDKWHYGSDQNSKSFSFSLLLLFIVQLGADMSSSVSIKNPCNIIVIER